MQLSFFPVNTSQNKEIIQIEWNIWHEKLSVIVSKYKRVIFYYLQESTYFIELHANYDCFSVEQSMSTRSLNNNHLILLLDTHFIVCLFRRFHSVSRNRYDCLDLPCSICSDAIRA